MGSNAHLRNRFDPLPHARSQHMTNDSKCGVCGEGADIKDPTQKTGFICEDCDLNEADAQHDADLEGDLD